MSDSFIHKVMISSGKLDKEKDYWIKKLSGELTVSGFPLDYPRPTQFLGNRGTAKFSLPKETGNKITNISNGSLFGIFMVVLTGVYHLLYRYTGNHDIIIGTPVFKQEQASGYLNDILALRVNTHSGMTFKDLLLEVKQTINEANENMNFPFEEILEILNLKASDNREALFDAFVVFKSIHDASLMESIKCDTAFVFEMQQGILKFEIVYNMDLFRQSTIERLGDCLTNCLKKITDNIMLRLSQIDILSDSERSKVLIDFNSTTYNYPKDKTIHGIFEEQVDKTPEYTAVVFENSHYTYRYINERSNQLARAIMKAGICSGDVVALAVPRTLGMVIGVMGVLKAGAVLLPIDIRYPRERIELILNDSGAKLLLLQSGHLDWSGFSGVTLNIEPDMLDSYEKSNLESTGRYDAAAYIIYTSGSTGVPKGVLLRHYGICNHVFTKIKELEIRKEDILCHNLSSNFVASIWQIFAPLFVGARLVVYTEEVINNPYEFFKRVERDRVGILEVVPSFLNSYLELVETGKEKIELSNLRALVLTGEKILPLLVNRFYREYRIRLVNAYGQSECSDDTLHYHIPYNTETLVVPLGRPSINTFVYILDECGNLQPIGAYGEIYISGDGVAKGYLNREELNREKFIRDPYRDGYMMYKTGDLGRWTDEGIVEFLGRKDNQVKIRGYRIELEEIEAQIKKLEWVNDAVAAVREEDNQNKYIAAYVVSDERQEVNKLRDFLADALPYYMIPKHYISIDRIPLNPNGKIDRKALPEPCGMSDPYKAFMAPETELEKELAGIWEEVLDLKNLGVSDNFFELGGHSLLAVKLEASLEKKGFELDNFNINDYPTIREMSKVIKRAGSN